MATAHSITDLVAGRKSAIAALDAARSATFSLPDGQSCSLVMLDEASRNALKALMANLGTQTSIDDALRLTALDEHHFDAMSLDQADQMIEVMDLIEQSAIDGGPNPKLTVSLH